MNDKITIISGPNGYGKTTILKLLDSFFRGKFTDIKNIPFKSFRLEFDNGELVNVYKNYFFIASQSLVDSSYDCILLKKPFPDEQDVFSYESDLITDNRIFFEHKSEASNEREIFAYSFYNYEKIELNSLNSSSNEISEIKEILKQKNKDKSFLSELLYKEFPFNYFDQDAIIYTNKANYEINYKEYIKNFVKSSNESNLPMGRINRQTTIYDDVPVVSEIDNIEVPDFFTKITKAISTQLIESQRLLYYGDNKDNTISTQIIESQRFYYGDNKYNTKNRRLKRPYYRHNDEEKYGYVVSRCSEEIKDKMLRCYKQYSSVSQKRDKTFPIRLVNAIILGNNEKIEISSLLSEYENLEKLQNQLNKLGLYPSSEDNSIPKLNGSNLHPETLLALKLYIEDNKRKLSAFSDLQKKMQKFKVIIEELLVNKSIRFSQNKGLVFKDLDTDIDLSPEQLSSGEQHIIVLFFDLLFRAERGSLILIDEPEISLHVAWQRKFIKILSSIINVVDMDVIVSTHSPSIVHNRMDLLVELEGVHK